MKSPQIIRAKAKPVVFTLRPAGTALWLPAEIAAAIKAERGDELTTDQFEHPQVVAHLAAIREREKHGRSES